MLLTVTPCRRSSWMHIDRLPNATGKQRWSIMHESPNGYRPGTGFTNFVQRTLQGKPGHLNLHTRPQRNMCLLPGIAPWDWTLKLEEIALWRDSVLQLLGLEQASVDLEWQNRNALRGGFMKSVDDLYSQIGQDLCDRLVRWMADDMHKFNYSERPSCGGSS